MAQDCRGSHSAMHVQGQPQIRHMTFSTEPYGVTAKFGLHNKPVNAMWEFSKVTTVSHIPSPVTPMLFLSACACCSCPAPYCEQPSQPLR